MRGGGRSLSFLRLSPAIHLELLDADLLEDASSIAQGPTSGKSANVLLGIRHGRNMSGRALRKHPSRCAISEGQTNHLANESDTGAAAVSHLVSK